MKRNYFLCLFALCAILITGCSGQKPNADNNDNAVTTEPAEQSTEESTEQPTEEASEQPAEEPAEEPVEEPTENSEAGATSEPSTAKSPSKKTKKISLAQAKAIALKEAGISEKGGRWEQAEEERENGRMIYELEFVKGKTEYDFEIDVETGKVLELKEEPVDD